MLGVQALVSFIAWLVVGYLLARRAPEQRAWLGKMNRRARVALGPVLMLAGAAIMLAAVWLAAFEHGLTVGGLAAWAWLALTLAGVIFIAAQSIAALMMVSLAVQNEPRPRGHASEGRITERKSDEVTTPTAP